jgi:hypothetical protein
MFEPSATTAATGVLEDILVCTTSNAGAPDRNTDKSSMSERTRLLQPQLDLLYLRLDLQDELRELVG